MSSALNIGTTGLAAASQQMDVIGNNLANANTVGFKASETNFASMLSQSLSSGGGASAVGQGVSVAAVSTLFGQGTFELTGNVTDMAIDGNGFFITKDTAGNTLYTRAGVFHVANDGLLVDINGYEVQGHTFESDGITEAQNLTNLNLQNALSQPAATTYFGIGVTLNTETADGGTFSSSQVVYDSQGGTHNLNTIFTKMEDDKSWALQTSLDANNATAQTYSGLKFAADGTIDKVYTADFGTVPTAAGGGVIASSVINNVGAIYKDTTVPVVLTRGLTANDWTFTNRGGYTNATFSLGTAGSDDVVAVDLDGTGGADITINLTTGAWANGSTISFTLNQTESAIANSDVRFHAIGATLSNGATIGTDGLITWNLAGLPNQDTPTISSYATTSRIATLQNDGYAPGLLTSLSVANDGIVEGRFSNGQRQSLVRILFADFANLQGLNKAGSYFIETVASGASVANRPGAGGLGELRSNSLEMSNTDTAKEFIKMITAQRTYQSSAKIITTADQMLQVLMNIKQ